MAYDDVYDECYQDWPVMKKRAWRVDGVRVLACTPEEAAAAHGRALARADHGRAGGCLVRLDSRRDGVRIYQITLGRRTHGGMTDLQALFLAVEAP